MINQRTDLSTLKPFINIYVLLWYHSYQEVVENLISPSCFKTDYQKLQIHTHIAKPCKLQQTANKQTSAGHSLPCQPWFIGFITLIHPIVNKYTYSSNLDNNNHNASSMYICDNRDSIMLRFHAKLLAPVCDTWLLYTHFSTS